MSFGLQKFERRLTRERPANKIALAMCHPCDMDLLAQDDTSRHSLDFIWYSPGLHVTEDFERFGPCKSPLSD
jgi:hypothetical protein